MDTIIYYLCIPLGYLIKWSYMLIGNYGLAIIAFTLLTKFVLLPLSVWIQKNSILMVKIQPEVNFIKARLHGNLDAIADEQSKLFKREKYHPMVSIVPLVIQIVLLMAVVYIIYHPLNYLGNFSSELINGCASFIGADVNTSHYQLKIIDAVKVGTIDINSNIVGATSEQLAEFISAVEGYNLSLFGLNLSEVPTEAKGVYYLVPVIAGISSWFMCWTQNMANVIQHEQSKWNKYGIMALSVGISLYLGLFVPAGIALYWTASNLFSIAQMYILNVVINPKKYVDYDALEESRKALAEAQAFGAEDKKDEKYKENKRREKEDYKKFKKVANKHIVFYSERSGFYKYYQGIIEELLKNSNVNIHYVTNDPDDKIFELAKEQPRIRPYYISLKKLVVLMMLVQTDIFVMTTPDLDKYYLKRSMMQKDIEYVYVPHDMMSVHMGFSEGALDAFDTIFCTGNHVVSEIRETEKVYKVKTKKLVEFGYPLADLLGEAGKKAEKDRKDDGKKQILIAPSWQEDNILDSCIDKLIEKLYSNEYRIIVRPHPEYAKRFGMQLKKLTEKYADRDKELLSFELDFSTNKSLYTSDLIITDWSGVAPEFCFATGRPALFVNTKMKVVNQNYKKIGLDPVEISLRNELGMAVEKEELENADQIVAKLLAETESYSKKIAERFDSLIFNHGTSAKVGAKYLLTSLVNKKKK